MRIAVTLFVGGVLASVGPINAAPLLFSASGPDVASISGTVDAYRTALGVLNGNVPVSFPSGRREINWDAVPEPVSSPNAFPGNFFNGNVPGRARGIVFATPGTEFQVSANAGPGVQFANLNPSYPTLFEPFSPNKLFTPVGATVTDASFFLPSDQTTPASVRGFGVIFSDVDLAGSSSIEFFNAGGLSLGTFAVPPSTGNETFSFLGLLFNDGTRIGRVRITSGNVAPGGSELLPGADAAVMDDFIYGEPAAIPEPVTQLLTGTGLLAVWIFRRKWIYRKTS